MLSYWSCVRVLFVTENVCSLPPSKSQGWIPMDSQYWRRKVKDLFVEGSSLQEVLNAKATDAVCTSTPVLVCIHPNTNQCFAFWDGCVEFHTSLQGSLASTHWVCNWTNLLYWFFHCSYEKGPWVLILSSVRTGWALFPRLQLWCGVLSSKLWEAGAAWRRCLRELTMGNTTFKYLGNSLQQLSQDMMTECLPFGAQLLAHARRKAILYAYE